MTLQDFVNKIQEYIDNNPDPDLKEFKLSYLDLHKDDFDDLDNETKTISDFIYNFTYTKSIEIF